MLIIAGLGKRKRNTRHPQNRAVDTDPHAKGKGKQKAKNAPSVASDEDDSDFVGSGSSSSESELEIEEVRVSNAEVRNLSLALNVSLIAFFRSPMHFRIKPYRPDLPATRLGPAPNLKRCPPPIHQSHHHPKCQIQFQMYVMHESEV